MNRIITIHKLCATEEERFESLYLGNRSTYRDEGKSRFTRAISSIFSTKRLILTLRPLFSRNVSIATHVIYTEFRYLDWREPDINL